MIHLENNHKKINTLEEIEIVKATSSKYQLNDVITGQNDPMYKLLPSVSDLNFKCQLPRPDNRRNFNILQLKESAI